jgi:thiol-disulfide isomerase/thioredoxin
MNSAKIILITLIAGVLSVGAGVLGHWYLSPEGRGSMVSLIPSPLKTRTTLPDFTLPDLDDRPQASSQWAGKVLVLNFWATWCPPCRKEIPAFMELQQQLGPRGLQFVGIAIDDPAAVRQFAATTDFNYPILLGDDKAIELALQLGDQIQGLPFSVIFDRRGRVIYRRLGELSPETIRSTAGPQL